jgi:hypothetical protein
MMYGGPCRNDQTGRPVVGYLNFSPRYIYPNETDPSRSLYWQAQMALRHELMVSVSLLH